MEQKTEKKEVLKNADEVRTASPLFLPSTMDNILIKKLKEEEEKITAVTG